MAQAFSGIRIVDFTQVLAGPYGVMQLALLGAEVIKIEQPVTGDQTRGLAIDGEGTGMAPSFLTCNVNKKSLALDLKSEAARDIITRLISTADVVVENFKAGTISRLGFDYESVSAIKPDIIYCSISGYGQTGPKAGFGAYDGAIQASSGMMSQTGHPETGPTRTGYMPVDMATALNAAFAISAALYRKARDGSGQHIDVAMMDTAIVVQAAQYSNYLNTGSLLGLQGNASPTRQPTADVFPTRDGHIQITALRPQQIKNLFELMGHPEQLAVEGFVTPNERIANAPTVSDFIATCLKTNTTAHWLESLGAAGIPVAEVRTLPEVVADPQFAHRGIFEQMPSPVDSSKTINIVKAGYVTNADSPDIHSPPPLLGQHTNEILLSLGFTDEQLQAWREAGTIQD